jgi:hypothetical protein
MTRRVVAVSLVSIALSLSACGGDSGEGDNATGDTTATTVAAVPESERSSFSKFKSTQAVDAFKKAALEAERPRPMAREDYGLAPLLATEGTRFYIPSLGPDSGGRVFSFAKADDLAKMKAYYDELGRTSAAFFSHTFVKDNLLVQINGAVKDADAAKYNAALQGVK